MYVPKHLLPHLERLGYHFEGEVTAQNALCLIAKAREQGDNNAAGLLAHVLVHIDKGHLCGDSPQEIRQQLS